MRLIVICWKRRWLTFVLDGLSKRIAIDSKNDELYPKGRQSKKQMTTEYISIYIWHWWKPSKNQINNTHLWTVYKDSETLLNNQDQNIPHVDCSMWNGSNLISNLSIALLK